MRDPDDLAARIKSQDPTGLEVLLTLYTGDVHAVAAAVLGPNASSDDVEEAVADAFVAAWRHGRRFDPARATVRTWLLMHARYAALEYRRRRRTVWDSLWPWSAATAPNPCDVVVARADQERLHAAILTLPLLDRQILYRRYFLGRDIAALATEFHLTRAAVDNRLLRARKRLRAELSTELSAREGDNHGS